MASNKLDDLNTPDLIVIGVKGYSLEAVANQLLEKFGGAIPVLSVLNGVDHVHLLTRKFDEALFATIGFNAFRLTPTESETAGDLITLSGSKAHSHMLQNLHSMLKHNTAISVADNPVDVASCKLIINLGNALLTLVAYHKNRDRQLKELQWLAANLMWEGVLVMQANGIKEVTVPALPPWWLLRLSKMLPAFIVVPIFKRKLRNTKINSMAQDIENESPSTEIEELNGYLLTLAENVGVHTPVNTVVYNRFKEWVKGNRQAIEPAVLLEEVRTFSKR